MKLKLKCPGCGAVYRLAERPSVDHVRCPTCKTRFPVDPTPPARLERSAASAVEMGSERLTRGAAGDVLTRLLFGIALICGGIALVCFG